MSEAELSPRIQDPPKIIGIAIKSKTSPDDLKIAFPTSKQKKCISNDVDDDPTDVFSKQPLDDPIAEKLRLARRKRFYKFDHMKKQSIPFDDQGNLVWQYVPFGWKPIEVEIASTGSPNLSPTASPTANSSTKWAWHEWDPIIINNQWHLRAIVDIDSEGQYIELADVEDINECDITYDVSDKYPDNVTAYQALGGTTEKPSGSSVILHGESEFLKKRKARKSGLFSSTENLVQPSSVPTEIWAKEEYIRKWYKDLKPKQSIFLPHFGLLWDNDKKVIYRERFKEIKDQLKDYQTWESIDWISDTPYPPAIKRPLEALKATMLFEIVNIESEMVTLKTPEDPATYLIRWITSNVIKIPAEVHDLDVELGDNEKPFDIKHPLGSDVTAIQKQSFEIQMRTLFWIKYLLQCWNEWEEYYPNDPNNPLNQTIALPENDQPSSSNQQISSTPANEMINPYRYQPTITGPTQNGSSTRPAPPTHGPSLVKYPECSKYQPIKTIK